MQSLLATLSELNVRISLDDDRLHVSAPTGAMTPALRKAISEHKGELVAHLKTVRTGAAPSTLPSIVPDVSKRYEPFPLNDVQHAYWIGREPTLELGSVSTHVYFEFDCE